MLLIYLVSYSSVSKGFSSYKRKVAAWGSKAFYSGVGPGEGGAEILFFSFNSSKAEYIWLLKVE